MVKGNQTETEQLTICTGSEERGGKDYKSPGLQEELFRVYRSVKRETLCKRAGGMFAPLCFFLNIPAVSLGGPSDYPCAYRL